MKHNKNYKFQILNSLESSMRVYTLIELMSGTVDANLNPNSCRCLSNAP